MEIMFDFLGTNIRGDFFLVAITGILAGLAGIITIFKSRSAPEDDLAKVLSKPEVIEALNAGANLTPLLEHIKNSAENSHRDGGWLGKITSKIADDIEWDIAGLIGILVTVVLLFMVVSGTISQAPEQMFTGWLLILGYYFGKGGRK